MWKCVSWPNRYSCKENHGQTLVLRKATDSGGLFFSHYTEKEILNSRQLPNVAVWCRVPCLSKPKLGWQEKQHLEQHTPGDLTVALPKFNIAPEKGWLEEKNPSGARYNMFRDELLNFQGVWSIHFSHQHGSPLPASLEDSATRLSGTSGGVTVKGTLPNLPKPQRVYKVITSQSTPFLT